MLRVRNLLPLFVLSVVLVYAALPDSSAVAAQAPGADDLILVPVMVSDSKDVPVTTLKQENFQLLEENKEQKIAYFSAAGEPMTVSVVFGLSAQGPVTSVGQRDRISVDITNAVQRVSEANAGGPATPIMSPLDSDGLFNMVTQAMTNLAKLPSPRKALVVVSDGLISSGSQASSIGPPKALLDGSKVSSFPIHFLMVSNSTTEPSMTEGSRYTTGYFLEQAADFSGGALHSGQIENNLTKKSADLRDALKNQYLLGFKTANTAKDGKWRKLAVKIVNPPAGAKLKIKAKDRYFVPKA